MSQNITNKIIYISESLNIYSKNNTQQNCQFLDIVNFVDSDINKNDYKSCFKSEIYISSKQSTNNNSYKIIEPFYVNFISKIENLILELTLQKIDIDINLNQNKYSVILSDNIFANDILQFNKVIIRENNDSLIVKQKWCQSDTVQKENLIKFSIQSNILVNDIVYSTKNISFFKFDIFDQFSFFIQNIQQYKQYINNLYDFSLVESQIVKKNDYYIKDSINGNIFSNKVKLSEGNHNIIIGKYNSIKRFCFTINVITPIYKKENCFVVYNKYDLKNLKIMPNYSLTEQYINDQDIILK